jgi:hypothetical protein
LKKGRKRGDVPVLPIHDRVELGALEPEAGHRALELRDRRLRVLHRQGGEAREAGGPLPRHRRDLVVDLARERGARRGVQVIAEERGVDREHLHVHALRVHVGQALLRREAHLGRGEAGALAVSAHEDAEAIAALVPEAVPLAAGLRGLPDPPRHHVRVDVDGPHEPLRR